MINIECKVTFTISIPEEIVQHNMEIMINWLMFKCICCRWQIHNYISKKRSDYCEQILSKKQSKLSEKEVSEKNNGITKLNEKVKSKYRKVIIITSRICLKEKVFCAKNEMWLWLSSVSFDENVILFIAYMLVITQVQISRKRNLFHKAKLP